MSDNQASLTADGKTVEMPVKSGTIGPDVIDIRKLYGQTGMFTYDPGFTSTASCDSALTYIDGVVESLPGIVEALADEREQRATLAAGGRDPADRSGNFGQHQIVVSRLHPHEPRRSRRERTEDHRLGVGVAQVLEPAPFRRWQQ